MYKQQMINRFKIFKNIDFKQKRIFQQRQLTFTSATIRLPVL